MSRNIMTNSWRRGLPAALAALALLIPAAAAPQQHFPSDDELRTMLRYLVEDGETPGIVLGVLEADGTTRIVSAGTGGPEARPLGPRSVFEIGSINKTFTGALLAIAAARGEVSLTDPVQKYLPAHVTVPTRNGVEITLEHLATHTSGLPRLPGNHTPADMADPYADYTIETMYDFLSGHTLRRDPGAEGEYSNLGFGLLGHALARAAGTSYRALVTDRILEPLGMSMTGWDIEGEIATWATRGHADGEVVSYWFGTEAIEGAGALRSSAADMLAYLEANAGEAETPLEHAMRNAHQSRAPIPDESGWGMGLGWQVQEYDGRTLVMHGGGTGGYSAYTGFDAEKGVGFVLLTNTRSFGDDIGRDFLRRGPPLPVADAEVARATLQRHAGAYQMEPGQLAFVRMERDGSLTLQVPDNVRFRLYADDDTTFVVKRAPWRVTFTRDSAGDPAMVLDAGESERVLPRVDAEIPPPAVVAGNAVMEAQELAAGEAERYTGAYTLQLGPRTLGIRVYIEDGVLHARADGQPASRLLYHGDGTFALEADPDIRIVFTAQGDRAQSLVLHQNGMEIPGTRDP